MVACDRGFLVAFSFYYNRFQERGPDLRLKQACSLPQLEEIRQQDYAKVWFVKGHRSLSNELNEVLRANVQRRAFSRTFYQVGVVLLE